MAEGDQQPRNAGVIAPPPLIVLTAVALGFAIDWLLGLGGDASVFALPYAVSLGIAAFALAGAAAWTMHRARTAVEPWKPTTHLVTHGVFGLTRNPIYLGMVLLMAALAIWFASPGIALMIPVAALILHYGVILREERYLITLFGDEYRAYMARVGRWLPPWRSLLIMTAVGLALTWLGALLFYVWIVAQFQAVITDDGAVEAAQYCSEANAGHVRRTLADALGGRGVVIGTPRCSKSPFNSDMVSAAELTPDSVPPGLSLTRTANLSEVPVDLLVDLWPEVFDQETLPALDAASGYHRPSRQGVAVFRTPEGRVFALVWDTP